jgi:hypothetical protein
MALQFVRGKNLAAAEGLANRKYGILAFHRLNVTFLSTNHVENVMRNLRGMIVSAQPAGSSRPAA